MRLSQAKSKTLRFGLLNVQDTCLEPIANIAHTGSSQLKLKASISDSTSLVPQALGRPINEQVNQGGRVALAPNRQADATLRTLDDLVMVGPVTQLPSDRKSVV